MTKGVRVGRRQLVLAAATALLLAFLPVMDVTPALAVTLVPMGGSILGASSLPDGLAIGISLTGTAILVLLALAWASASANAHARKPPKPL